MKYSKLTEAKNELDSAMRILKEEYGIDSYNDEFNGEYQNMDDASIEGEGGDLGEKDERIDQIREVALEGLQDYAHNVDSEMYQFYKKIWLMCDKAVSDKDSVGEGEK